MSGGDPDAPGDERPDGRGSEPDAPGDADADADANSGSDPGDDAPLSDLADRVRRRARDRGDGSAEGSAPDLDAELSDGPPPDPDEDPFDRMSVGEIDEAALWSSLGSDDTAGVGVGAGTAARTDTDVDPGATDGVDSLGGVGPAPGVESVGDATQGVSEHVVPKDKYCQSCPYLDDPPELACTHEGTEIVAVVDSERFRVRNCPMVEDGVEPKE